MLSKPSSICWRSIFNSSLVLGFVGAGGIGFELLTAMNLFQYRTVSLLPLVTFRVSDRGRTAFGRAPTLDRLIAISQRLVYRSPRDAQTRGNCNPYAGQ